MKGEENTVMRDYVLPDFSSIKKGFCKVRAGAVGDRGNDWPSCDDFLWAGVGQ